MIGIFGFETNTWLVDPARGAEEVVMVDKVAPNIGELLVWKEDDRMMEVKKM